MTLLKEVTNKIQVVLSLRQCCVVDFSFSEFPSLLGVHRLKHIYLLNKRYDEWLDNALNHGLTLLIILTVLYYKGNTFKYALVFPLSVPVGS